MLIELHVDADTKLGNVLLLRACGPLTYCQYWMYCMLPTSSLHSIGLVVYCTLYYVENLGMGMYVQYVRTKPTGDGSSTIPS
jgi:hypothetical protein